MNVSTGERGCPAFSSQEVFFSGPRFTLWGQRTMGWLGGPILPEPTSQVEVRTLSGKAGLENVGC